MIQANELRIGNWFKDKIANDYFQVIELTKDSITFDYMSIHPNWQAIPVPLTEEILLKCGFIKVVNGFLHKEMRYSDVFKIREDGYVVYINNNTYIAKVMYLHQLQNLYFALTGQELELNL